jgi:hypothetical protein
VGGGGGFDIWARAALNPVRVNTRATRQALFAFMPSSPSRSLATPPAARKRRGGSAPADLSFHRREAVSNLTSGLDTSIIRIVSSFLFRRKRIA